MLVRALVLGWDLHAVAPGRDALTEYDNNYDFVAMVPYQLHHAIDALDKVKKMIVEEAQYLWNWKPNSRIAPLKFLLLMA